MFKPENLSALSCAANNFTLWNYRTDDPYLEVFRHGYFNAADLRPGDFIFVNSTHEAYPGQPMLSGLIAVSSITDGHVTVYRGSF